MWSVRSGRNTRWSQFCRRWEEAVRGGGVGAWDGGMPACPALISSLLPQLWVLTLTQWILSRHLLCAKPLEHEVWRKREGRDGPYQDVEDPESSCCIGLQSGWKWCHGYWGANKLTGYRGRLALPSQNHIRLILIRYLSSVVPWTSISWWWWAHGKGI